MPAPRPRLAACATRPALRRWHPRLPALILVLVVALALAGVPPAGAAPIPKTILVDPTSPCFICDGTTWPLAFHSLQDALDVAVAGDEIWVAKGTYKPSTPSGRSATFQLVPGVAIYGGFPPGGGAMEHRNFHTYASILSGNLGTPGRSYHVVPAVSAGSTTILDGFTISDGLADSATSPNDRGAGVYVDGGHPTLRNRRITGNTASTGGGMYDDGAGPTLTSVTFTDNTSTQAGGMYNGNGSHPSLLDVTFTGNQGGVAGGGMVNSSGSNPTLTQVSFKLNLADVGGGMYNNGSDPVLDHTEFISNTAGTGLGGGMANFDSTPALTEVTFRGNSAESL